jgi:hypothetical protein
VNDLDFKSEAINAVEANMMGKRKEDKEEKKKKIRIKIILCFQRQSSSQPEFKLIASNWMSKAFAIGARHQSDNSHSPSLEIAQFKALLT